jgi:RHS repeat-associated protein
VDLPTGDVVEYLVDGGNRRVGKLVNGVLVKRWLWKDQLRIAAELDGSGTVVSQFVYGDRTGTTPELVIQNGTVYRVVSDHLGSVRALVNLSDANDVPVLLEYDAFGGVSGTGVGVVPQGFAGGLYDQDTGWVRFGMRDYDPMLGRWASKDPLLLRGDGPNVFGYVLGDPINLLDPTGACIPCALPFVEPALAAAAAGVLAAAAWLGWEIGSEIDKASSEPASCEDDDSTPDDNVKRRCFSSIHGAGVTRSASYWASYWRVKCTWWSRASRPTRRPHPGSQQASGSPLNAASSGVRTGARRCVDGTV